MAEATPSNTNKRTVSEEDFEYVSDMCGPDVLPDIENENVEPELMKNASGLVEPDDTRVNEVESSISSFNEVIFHNVMHQYPVEAHVECRFVCEGDVHPNSKDWVGLFKVGWTSIRKYATYSFVKPIDEQQATAFFMSKYFFHFR